jgi:hypothetical protein
MNQRRQTAVHEAAHAVIARALGIASGEVTIVGEGGHSLGHSVFDDPRFRWTRGDGKKSAAANNFAIALFAAAEAERLILNAQETGDSVDCERATACLAWAGAVRNAMFVGDENFDRHEANLRRKAAALVRQYRPQIEQVAEALDQRGTLSGSEIDAVVSPL